MRAIIIASIVAASFASIGTQAANASGNKSYAYQYCHYYKARALGAESLHRKDLMWAKYYACLEEYSG
jgi:hypothetical protein